MDFAAREEDPGEDIGATGKDWRECPACKGTGTGGTGTRGTGTGGTVESDAGPCGSCGPKGVDGEAGVVGLIRSDHARDPSQEVAMDGPCPPPAWVNAIFAGGDVSFAAAYFVVREHGWMRAGVLRGMPRGARDFHPWFIDAVNLVDQEIAIKQRKRRVETARLAREESRRRKA
jgi:hypothetical protein